MQTDVLVLMCLETKRSVLSYVNFFSKQFNKPVPKIEKSVLEHLKQYDFPGNVRELKNIVERAIILTNEPVLTLNDFPIKLSDKQKNKTENYETEVEKIKKALELNDFNQSKAAKYLGISRDALIRKMKKIMQYLDGKNTAYEISLMVGLDFKKVLEILKICHDNNLITKEYLLFYPLKRLKK